MFDILLTKGMSNYIDEHEAFAASRSSDYVYVPINNENFTTLDKHAETIEMDIKLPLVCTKNMFDSNSYSIHNSTVYHKQRFSGINEEQWFNCLLFVQLIFLCTKQRFHLLSSFRFLWVNRELVRTPSCPTG